MWYDHFGNSYLDYPLLTGYLHYVASFIYSYLNPHSLETVTLEQLVRNAELLSVTPEIKFAMRTTIYVVTLLTYYPLTVAAVMLLVSAQKPLLRLVVISLLLNAPLFILFDFTLLQFNCVHYGLFFMAYVFAYREEFVKSTIAACLCIFFKHICAFMVLPIGFYAIGCTLRDAKKPKIFDKLKAAALTGIKLVLIGSAVCLIILIPLIRGGAMSKMLRNILSVERRSLLCKAVNLWSFLFYLVAPHDTEENRPMFINICMSMVVINGIAACLLILKKPTKYSFATAFTLTNLGTFIYGFYMHEKHITYSYFALVLSIQFTKDILPLAYQVSIFGVFYMCVWNAAIPFQIFLLTFGVGHAMVCKLLIDRNPELQVVYIVRKDRECAGKRLKRCLEWINERRPKLMKWFSAYMAGFYLVNLWSEISLLSFIDDFRRVGLYGVPFLVIVLVYVHQWISLCLYISDDIEIKEYKKV